MKRTIRIKSSSRKLVVSFGSGSAARNSEPEHHDDDDLEFFDAEETSTTVVVYGKFRKTKTVETCVKKWSCLWCWTEAVPDDRGRFGRVPCPNCRRHGVTNLKMSDKKTVYIEDDDE